MDQSALTRFTPAIFTAFATLLLAVNSVNATPSDTRINETVSGVVRDFDNTPLADVAVFYIGTGSNLGSTLTDAHGIYTFTLSADTYEVSVSKIGYPAPDKKIVVVPPGHSDVDFIFPERFLVTGHIRDSQSNPLVDALVAAFGTGANSVTALTDVNGAYTLTLKADTYLISVMKSGYVDPPQQSMNVPPAHNAVDFTLDSAIASITPSPTITFTATPTPTATVMPTATSTLTGTSPNTATIFLPAIVRQNTITPVPSITPSSSPTPSRTPSVTPSAGNHSPVFPQPLPITVVTQNEFDNDGRLIGAVTTITITAATDIDGDGLVYHWSATTGTIVNVSANGLVGQWRRIITSGRVQGGTVGIVADDNHGGTAEASLNFP